MKTAFVGETVIDGTDGRARQGLAVLVDGDRILEVGPPREFGAGTRVVDVSGRTLMPGLIDTHMHFAAWAQWLISSPGKRLMFLASQTVHGLGRALERGVTGARDMGGLDAGFVDGVARGLIPGPRLQTAVVILQPTAGVTDNIPGQGGTTSQLGLCAVVPGMPLPYCNGPWEARAKVREALRAGADVIKIASTSMTICGQPRWDAPALTQAEIDAIVDEAHSVGITVHSHAMGGPGLVRAVKGGVDTIEHGNELLPETADEMAKKGIWLVPMFWILRFHAEGDPEQRHRDLMRRLWDVSVKSFDIARRAGVRIAMGSDSGTHDPQGDGSAVEVQYMVDAGMSAGEAIVAATRGAAECMRIQGEVGTLEPGKLADLLVLDGNPLDDVRILQRRDRLALVVKGGQAVAGTMLGSGFDRLRLDAMVEAG